MLRLYPIEITESPQVREADNQKREENTHVNQCTGAKGEWIPSQISGRSVGDRPGIKEDDFYGEDQIDQCNDVETEVKLNMCRPNGQFSALVGFGLFRVRIFRAKQSPGPKSRKPEKQAAADEQENRKQRWQHTSNRSGKQPPFNTVADGRFH